MQPNDPWGQPAPSVSGYGAPPPGYRGPPPPYGPAGPYGSPVPTMPPAARFQSAWHARASTDYLFSFWTALGWTILTLGVFGLFVLYQLVRRMRDHNRRRIELLDAALAVAWEDAGRQSLREELAPAFARAAGHLGVMRQMTTDFRDPTVWLVLAFVTSIAQIVAYVLLDQDLVRHDQAEGGVEHELAMIYGRLGHPLASPDPSRVKGRDNYVARIIVSVVTFGIYGLWWLHDQMVKPNEHFQANWAQEDQLARAVEAIVA